jgi:BASS family bile acid:Na+ symporter
LKAYREDLAALVKPVLDAISNVGVVLIVALILLINIDKVLHIFSSHGITAAVLPTILGVDVGWLVGAANAGAAGARASTGTRNSTLAIVLASQSFDDSRVEIMVIVAAVIGLLIVLPVCWVWGMRPVASGQPKSQISSGGAGAQVKRRRATIGWTMASGHALFEGFPSLP